MFSETTDHFSSGNTWGEKAWTKYYINRPGWIDVMDQFRELVKKFSKPNVRILEIGAGPTNDTSAFLASIGNVTGLDIDPEVKNNKYCKNSIVYDGVHIPCDSHSFHLVVASFALEHVEYPRELCQEIHRVLRRGGQFIFLTTNLWHYYSLAAKLMPHWFHMYLYKRLLKIPISYEPYPTFHRMNTKGSCQRILKSSGFEIRVMKVVEMGPFYATGSRLMFYPLMIWQRILDLSSLFENLRSNILCVASAIKQR